MRCLEVVLSVSCFFFSLFYNEVPPVYTVCFVSVLVITLFCNLLG